MGTASVVWDPEDRRPADAEQLEEEILKAAPGAQVKLTLRNGVWTVRALRPAAMCSRGASAGERDASAVVAAILVDAGHAAAR
jgi:hypothetical protein